MVYVNVTSRDLQLEKTRQALIEEGCRAFAANGFADTSAQEIVAACHLTRGALYHHFPDGKEGLFRAVHHDLQRGLVEKVRAVSASATATRHDRLQAYFEAAADPAYRQIVLIDGPTVLSVDDWNRAEFDVAQDVIAASLEDIPESHPAANLDVGLLSEILFAAFGQAAISIANAKDRDAATAHALEIFDVLLPETS